MLQQVTPQNIDNAILWTTRLIADGGTNIMGPLQSSVELLHMSDTVDGISIS
jgi:hypothetical protein